MKNTNVKNVTRPNPADDGITHINIYSRGATLLGQQLSHFYYAPFTHPVFGPFNCMEGLWHWVKSEEREDELRRMNGWQAKNRGKKLTKKYLKNFPEVIMAANFYKIEQNMVIKEELINSTLPFEHYYVFGPANVVISPDSADWLIAGFDEIRTMLREGRRPPEIDYMSILSPEG